MSSSDQLFRGASRLSTTIRMASSGSSEKSSMKTYRCFTPAVSKIALDLSPFLRQAVKTQNPFKGELSHGIVEKDFHQGVQAGGDPAVGTRGIAGRSGSRFGSEPERAAPLAA